MEEFKEVSYENLVPGKLYAYMPTDKTSTFMEFIRQENGASVFKYKHGIKPYYTIRVVNEIWFLDPIKFYEVPEKF